MHKCFHKLFHSCFREKIRVFESNESNHFQWEIRIFHCSCLLSQSVRFHITFCIHIVRIHWRWTDFYCFTICLRFYSQHIKCMLGQTGLDWVLLSFFCITFFANHFFFFFLSQHTTCKHDCRVCLHLTHLIHHICCNLWMLECLEISTITILYTNVCICVMMYGVWPWHKRYHDNVWNMRRHYITSSTKQHTTSKTVTDTWYPIHMTNGSGEILKVFRNINFSSWSFLCGRVESFTLRIRTILCAACHLIESFDRCSVMKYSVVFFLFCYDRFAFILK